MRSIGGFRSLYSSAQHEQWLQITILNEAPEMHLQMVSSHGMLAILEVLEGKCSRDVTLRLLQILNLVGLGLSFIVGLCSEFFFAAGHRRPRVPGKFLLDWWYSCHDGYVSILKYVT